MVMVCAVALPLEKGRDGLPGLDLLGRARARVPPAAVSSLAAERHEPAGGLAFAWRGWVKSTLSPMRFPTSGAARAGAVRTSGNGSGMSQPTGHVYRCNFRAAPEAAAC